MAKVLAKQQADALRLQKGDRVRIVDLADYDQRDGVIAWVDEYGDSVGVWLDGSESEKTPLRFLKTEVRRV